MIIFPLKLQTIVTAQTMYTGGEKEDKLKDWLHHAWWSYKVWHNNTTADKLLITTSLYKIIYRLLRRLMALFYRNFTEIICLN